jgi:hypothetical protein
LRRGKNVDLEIVILASNRNLITSEHGLVRNVETNAHDENDGNNFEFASKRGRFATVALEQPAKPVFASDLGDRNADRFFQARINNLLREEVALPKGFCMPSHKLVPCTLSTIGTDFETIPLEDRFDGIASDGFDTQLSQLTKNSCVSPTILVSEFEDNLLDIDRCSFSTSVLSLRLFIARLLAFPNPFPQRIGMPPCAK